MAEKKKNIFSRFLDEIRKFFRNMKTITWLPIRSGKDGKEGLLKKFFKITGFIFATAMCFVAIDALVSAVLIACVWF